GGKDDLLDGVEEGGEALEDLLSHNVLLPDGLDAGGQQDIWERRAALERVLSDGLPGAHHFYITFKTRASGVSVAPDILAKYPDEM
ncbi:hypothetical protein KGD90_31975, partial [Rhodococcus qingshengii]|nr:hypothetical protein [Rhodococcus qingshengii]